MNDEAVRRPIRLVVSDDLERSRLTVFFRLVLAIPHLFWISLWGIAAGAVAFVMWLAILFEGRAPGTLHRFVASYVRYTVHVGAYVNLAAGPYPGFTGQTAYPVDVEIDPPARQSRRSAAFRIVVALPALLLATVLGGSIGTGLPSAAQSSGSDWRVTSGSAAGVALTCAFLGWFAGVARGRMPRGLRDLVSYCLGYGAQTLGYLLLLTDRYPSSDPSLVAPPQRLPPHPVTIRVEDDLARSRLTVFFRLLLAIPHMLWLTLWTIVVVPAVILAWVAALVIGRVPAPLHRFLAAWIRYSSHVTAFVYLVGGPFPGFVGAEGSYPIRIAIDPAARQRRLVTLFRLVLGVPAFLVAGALGGALLVVAVLGWWYALVRGRMPEGLRNLGASCVRYSAQTYAYALLVTDRYPYAAPVLHDAPPDEEPALVPATAGPPELSRSAEAEPA